MEDKELIEPNDDSIAKTKELTEIINNHINNSVLLFNLQTKFNDNIYKKIEASIKEANNKLESNISVNSDSKLLLNIIDKLIDNYSILPEINNKIDDYFLYNSIFIGLSMMTVAVICIIRK
jgi:hypothetical protein